MANTNINVLPQGERHPLTAAFLSVIPGLGQLYVGDKRKGILFLDVALINYSLLFLMCCSGSIIESLRKLAGNHHFNVNTELLSALNHAHLGSPAFLLLVGLSVLFAAYAARDAYDKAFGVVRRKIYGDSIMELSEATSGSYLGHIALMVSCVVLAAFFVHPPTRIIDRAIEFEITQQAPVQKIKPKTRVQAEKPVAAHGRKQNEKRQVVAKQQPPTEPRSATKFISSKAPVPRPTEMTESSSPPPAPQPNQTSQRSSPQPLPVPAQAAKLTPRPLVNPTQLATPQPNLPAPRTMETQKLAMLPTLPGVISQRAAATQLAAPAMPNAVGRLFPIGIPSLEPNAISTVNKSGFSAPAVRVGSSFTGHGSAPTPMAVNSTNGTGTHSAPNVVAVNTRGTGSRTGNDPRGDSSIPSPIRMRESSEPGSKGSGFMVAPTGRTNPSRSIDDKPATEATTSDREINWAPYMAELQRRIKSHWYPPKHSENLRAVVTFKIHTDGNVSDVQIIHHGGLSVYDEAAVKAINSGAPYRHLPAGAPESVDIEFTFDFNVMRTPSTAPFRTF